jgi:ATP-dependent Zn protease
MGAARRKKIATAWHEAGHIVVGTHFGFRLIRASMKPRDLGSSEVSLGQTEWEGGGSGVIPVICMALAGRAVEERRYGTFNDDGYRDDLALIRTYAWIWKTGGQRGYAPHASIIPRLTALYRERPERAPLEVKRLADELVNRAMPKSVRVINDRWTDVECLAGLLLKDATVTSELLAQYSIRQQN